MSRRNLQLSPNTEQYERYNSSLLVYGKAAVTLDRKAKTNKVAVFDLDETIITTKSKAKFALSVDDWKFKHPTVTQVIRKHHRKGFILVIVTNQLGITRGKLDIDDFSTKVSGILAKLAVPVLLLAATEHDEFRKPALGTWRYLLEEILGLTQNSVDSASFFCGDSAGRRRKSSPSDHSSCDLLYALNCGLRFYLPENLFFDDCQETVSLLDHHHKMVVREEFERRFVLPLGRFERICVLIIGPPKSGKSVIAGFFNGFTVFDCTDALQCTQEALTDSVSKENFRVVVECPHDEDSLRKKVLRVFKAADAFVACFCLKYDYELMKEVYYHANYSPYVQYSTLPFLPEDYSKPTRDLRNRGFNTTFEISYFPPSFTDPCSAG